MKRDKGAERLRSCMRGVRDGIPGSARLGSVSDLDPMCALLAELESRYEHNMEHLLAGTGWNGQGRP